MMTANEAREMYLTSYDSVVKFQTEQLITIAESEITNACENAKCYILLDTTKYNIDTIKNVGEIFNGYGYFVTGDGYKYLKISW